MEELMVLTQMCVCMLKLSSSSCIVMLCSNFVMFMFDIPSDQAESTFHKVLAVSVA